MSSSPSTTSTPVVPESNFRQSAGDFVRWACDQLELKARESDGVLTVSIPEEKRSNFSGQAEVQVALSPSTVNDAQHAANFEDSFCEQLLEQLHQAKPYVSIRPCDQPTAVNAIAQRLFDAYRIDGGHAHLGGCQLTDFPFLRLSFLKPGENELRHLFVAHDGSAVSDKLAEDLGLLDIEPITKHPPRIEEPALQTLIAAGKRVAAQDTSQRDPGAVAIEPTLVTVIWVKHASGTLKFTIGENTVDSCFSGWAKLLQPQPYVSSKTGASSFHLAATDDGRIDAYEQIAACQQSGKRVLEQDLVTCSVTGKRVLEEFTETCPVSGNPCLTDAFEVCSLCQQRVSRAVLKQGICSACRDLQKIKKDDPRLVWILGEHTGLDRWNHWQLSETKDVYIALASGWTKRLLVVVDKESLEVQHSAVGSKFSSTWTTLNTEAQREMLS